MIDEQDFTNQESTDIANNGSLLILLARSSNTNLNPIELTI
jgi:hypothetical protein